MNYSNYLTVGTDLVKLIGSYKLSYSLIGIAFYLKMLALNQAFTVTVGSLVVLAAIAVASISAWKFLSNRPVMMNARNSGRAVERAKAVAILSTVVFLTSSVIWASMDMHGQHVILH